VGDGAALSVLLDGHAGCPVRACLHWGAMWGPAARADYVLPASSQYEKCEYTLFTFETPTNYIHVRRPVLDPLPGSLPEPEIYLRLARACGLLPPPGALETAREAALNGLEAFGPAFEALLREHPQSAPAAALLLYATLGASLLPGTAAAAPLWASAQRLALTRGAAVARALGADANMDPRPLGALLFQRIVDSPSGTAFSTDDSVWDLIETADRRVRLAIPPLLDEIAALDTTLLRPDARYPFVLSAGQRRAQNVNQILRTPHTRKRDPDGALFIHPADLAELGLAEAGWIVVESARGRVVARARVDSGLRRGYVVLPHGYGQAYPAPDGARRVCGPRVNQLTDARWRDPIAGTPYHKHVPVRLRPADATESDTAEQNAQAIFASAS